MKRKWILVSLAIGFLLLCLFRLQSNELLNASDDRQESAGQESTLRPDRFCGPKALHTAFGLLGEPVRLDQLKKEIPCGGSGTTFGALRSAAARHGYRAVLKRCSWEEMLNFNTTAVLWVKGNHFLAVDTRLRQAGSWPSGEQAIDAYDNNVPAETWTRAQTEAVWTGEALILIPTSPKSVQPGQPKVDWEQCIADAGFISSTDLTEFRFTFYNRGDSPLIVKVAGASCSCTKTALTNTEVMRGQAAELIVTIDPRGRRGFFISEIAVASNDPTVPLSFLYIRGFVGNRHTVSVRDIRFSDVSRGQTREKRFAIYATGQTAAEIGKPLLQWSKGIDGRYLHALVRCWRIERNDLSEDIKLKIKPGDYIVSLAVSADPDCPVGSFSGRLRFPTPLLHSEEPLDISFTGDIVSDISVQPKVLSLRSGRDGTAVAEFSLSRLSGGVLDLEGVSATGNLTVDHVSTGVYESVLKVKLVVRGIGVVDQVCVGILCFRANQEIIRVPTIMSHMPSG